MSVVEEADKDSSEEEVYLSDVESQDNIEYNPGWNTKTDNTRKN